MKKILLLTLFLYSTFTFAVDLQDISSSYDQYKENKKIINDLSEKENKEKSQNTFINSILNIIKSGIYISKTYKWEKYSIYKASPDVHKQYKAMFFESRNETNITLGFDYISPEPSMKPDMGGNIFFGFNIENNIKTSFDKQQLTYGGTVHLDTGIVLSEINKSLNMYYSPYENRKYFYVGILWGLSDYEVSGNGYLNHNDEYCEDIKLNCEKVYLNLSGQRTIFSFFIGIPLQPFIVEIGTTTLSEHQSSGYITWGDNYYIKFKLPFFFNEWKK